MNFEVLKRNHLKRNIVLGVVAVLIISTIILNFTRAKYRTTQSIPLVNGTINYSLADLNIVAITVDGEASDTIPEGNYELTENSYCTVNGEEDSSISISYEADTQLLTVTPFTTKGTKCYLDFVKKSSATETIEELYPNNQNMLAYDDYNNLRYIGADPNNYVLFNNELWRIIGVFSEDTHGVSGEKLIKIIRNESLGNMQWHSAGYNDWSKASLKTTLNDDYLNGTGSYATIGIKSDSARNMIATVTWRLGQEESYMTASMFYKSERGTTVYNGRPTTWSGKVALMYPSDYLYATSGGSTTNKATCLAKESDDWSSTNFSDCKNNDWLYVSNAEQQWTLTSSSVYSDYVYCVYYGNVEYYSNYAHSSKSVYPSLYLTSSVSITGGTGTSTDPYALSI